MPQTTRALHASLIVLTCLCVATAEAHAGKLGRVSDAARSSGSSDSSTGSSDSGSSDDSGSSCCSSGGDSDGAGLVVFFYVLTSPWWGPKMALEPQDAKWSSGFPRYPYAWPSEGSMIIDTEPDPSEAAKHPLPKRSWAFQWGAESGYVLDRVWREGLSIRLQTVQRIDFDANWSLFMERQPGAYTNLATGREHIVWRFAESSHVQFHTSFGAQHLVDSQGTVSGIDFTYGFEIYPAKPLTITVEGALGNLESVFAPRVRATLGTMVKRFELFLGYEHQWIGSETLGGPFAGVRLWL